MTDNSEILLRRAEQEDREKVIRVESLSTPNLSYIPYVWDMFLDDDEGDWSVAEINGEVVGCGKYSILPDGSAWLETLRVVPHRQGLGVGKRFYEHWFNLSREKDVKTMRMYTGIRNEVSRGLAEKYGLRLAERFRGTFKQICNGGFESGYNFYQIKDTRKATKLLMTHSASWGEWLVMNRTFYNLSPDLCAYLARNGMLYKNPDSNNLISLGARFMPKHGLHIGLFTGDVETCLNFAIQTAVKQGTKKLHCLFPSYKKDIEDALTDSGFQLESADFLVMEANLY